MQFQSPSTKSPLLRSSYGNPMFSPMNPINVQGRPNIIPHAISSQQQKMESIEAILKKKVSTPFEPRKVADKLPLDVSGQFEKTRRGEHERSAQDKYLQDKVQSIPIHANKGTDEDHSQFRVSFNTPVRKQQNLGLRNTTNHNWLSKFNFPVQTSKKATDERSSQINNPNSIKPETTNSSFRMPSQPFPSSSNTSYPTHEKSTFRPSRKYTHLQQPSQQQIKEQIESPPKVGSFINSFNNVVTNEPKFSWNEKNKTFLPIHSTQTPFTVTKIMVESLQKKESMMTIESKKSMPTAETASLVTTSSISTLTNEDKFEMQEGKNSRNLAETYLLTNSSIPSKCIDQEDKKLTISVSSKHFSPQSNVFKFSSGIMENKTQENKQKKKIVNGKFEIGPELGKGRFGEVVLCRHIETGFILAMKRVSKAKVKEYQMIKQFAKEIQLHSSFEHPYIIHFYGFFEEGNDICLLMEYMNGGTLFDSLNELGSLNIKDAVKYLSHVIKAVTYMHSLSIAHRDIKPENIVLSTSGVAKLCDFGWAALVQAPRKTYCGTFDYACPEILEHKQYDTAVDIWCIGMLAYELLVGKMPFEGQRKEVMKKIVNINEQQIPYPDQFPPEAKAFIQKLLQKDPFLRPKSTELLKFSLFTMHLENKEKKK